MKIKNLVKTLLFLGLLCPSLVLAEAPGVPTLKPVNQDSLLITGLTQKNTEVVVYVDGEFIGLADMNESESETSNFKFSLVGLLEAGEHEVVVAAKDKQSLSLSNLSPVQKFTVSEERKKQAMITAVAVSEASLATSAPETRTNEEIVTGTETSEEINGGSKKGLYWNLAIFSFFLVAVIAWIFFVNRELEKEKEEKAKLEN